MADFINYLKTLKSEDWNKMATPKWTVKDVVAHMIGWEKRDAQVIPIFWQTKKREPWMSTREEWDEFNRREVEERRNRTPRQLIEEWEMWQKKVEEEVDKIGYQNIKSRPDLFDWLLEGEDNKGGAYTLDLVRERKRRYPPRHFRLSWFEPDPFRPEDSDFIAKAVRNDF